MIADVSAQNLSKQPTASSKSRGKYKSVYESLRGKKIRHIRIKINNIFTDEIIPGKDPYWFYETVDSLKIQTKEFVVRQELVFKEGEEFNPFLLDESGRNLRQLLFLTNIDLKPVADGEFVDIEVSVQDTWTLVPTVQFSSGGGQKTRSLGLAETNLLGYGKRVEFYYRQDETRNQLAGIYDDRRLFGGREKLLLAHYDRSDGFRNITSVGLPYRNLIDPNSWNLSSDISDLVGRLYKNGGEESFIYRVDSQEINANFSKAYGKPENGVRRYYLGYSYDHKNFSMAKEEDYKDVDIDPSTVSQDPKLLATDRKFSGPYVGFDAIETEFVSLEFIDKFIIKEDYNLGNQLNTKLQYAPEFLGSIENNFLLSLSDSDGWKFADKEFLRAEAGIALRNDLTHTHNILYRAEAKYFNVLGDKYISDLFMGLHTLAANISLDLGENLDNDRQFILGATDGLRGYKFRAFEGDYRFIFNIEDRFFLFEDVLKLANIGGAFFFDAGGTSDKGPGDLLRKRIYSDIGVGLRFQTQRAGAGNVLRVDLALPLRDTGEDDFDKSPRLLISIGQEFSASLRSEVLGAEKANISIGQTE